MNLKRKIALFIVNRIVPGTRCFKFKRSILKWGGYKIGENTKVVGPIFITAKLEIGSNCWMGKNLTINGNGKVVIGNNVDIAPEVTFNTGGHEVGSHEHRAGQGHNYTQIIGDGCWVCAKVNFVNEINVGDGCVVAAGALVTKSFEEDSLIGGVPAKKIKKLD